MDKDYLYVRLDKITYTPYHDLITLPRKLKSQFIELMKIPTGRYIKEK